MLKASPGCCDGDRRLDRVVTKSAHGTGSRDARGDTLPRLGITASPSSFALLLIREEIHLVRANQTERE